MTILRRSALTIFSLFGKTAQLLNRPRHEIIELSANGRDTFFGYYDKTPFSLDDRLVLGLNRRADDKGTVDIGYFDLEEQNRFVPFGRTTTWSWQLGARLQWLPGAGQDSVCYNKIVDGQFGCVVQNVSNGTIEAEYGAPIFDISPDARYALGVNFARLYRMRKGYGYGNMPDPTQGIACPEKDGIIRIDLTTGESETLLSLASIAALQPLQSMDDAEHYVNHISFSPGGTRFMFLHLWRKDGKSFSRAVTCDIDGREPYVIDEDVNLSHYAWQSESTLLIHTSRYPNGVSFNLYRDGKPGRTTIGKHVLTESGHPSYSPDGARLIVDTYPDITRRQRLLLCAPDGSLIEDIGHFYSPRKFSGNAKCDLHPRWDHRGKRICIDSAHRGRRSMYIINLDSPPGERS